MDTGNTPPEGRIVVEAQGPVLRIGIDRPAKRNGFTPAMFEQLARAYTRLDDDDALRVGVLHAFGDHFTGGIDLPAMAPRMQRGEPAYPWGLVDPLDLGQPGHRRRRKPMVVAVKGICFTIGIELMLAADIAIAADDTRFAQLEVQRGIMATGGATLRMAERCGTGHALRLLLTGDSFDSDTALRLNLVQQVVPASAVLDEAMALAARIAEQAPLAVLATRANVRKAVELGPVAAAAEFVAVQQRLALTDDAAEGVRAFTERRTPRFSGR